VSADDQDDKLAAIGIVRARMRGDAAGVDELLRQTEPARMVNVARHLAALGCLLARPDDWETALESEFLIALKPRG
jgi:hypothetical protein